MLGQHWYILHLFVNQNVPSPSTNAIFGLIGSNLIQSIRNPFFWIDCIFSAHFDKISTLAFTGWGSKRWMLAGFARLEPKLWHICQTRTQIVACLEWVFRDVVIIHSYRAICTKSDQEFLIDRIVGFNWETALNFLKSKYNYFKIMFISD